MQGFGISDAQEKETQEIEQNMSNLLNLLQTTILEENSKNQEQQDKNVEKIDQSVQSQEKKKKTVSFNAEANKKISTTTSSAFGGNSSSSAGGQKTSSGVGGPPDEGGEIIIYPRKKKWTSEKPEQEQVDYQGKDFVMRKVEKKTDFDDNNEDLDRDEEFETLKHNENDILSKNTINSNRDRDQVKRDNFMESQQIEKSDNKKSSQQENKLYQMQKDILKMVVEKTDKQRQKSDVEDKENQPSGQLEMYKFYKEFEKEEEAKLKDIKNHQDFYTPKLYQKEQKNQKLDEEIFTVTQQQNQEEGEENGVVEEEEELDAEKETNDSEMQNQGVLCEVSKEIISENKEKKEIIYRVKYNNGDMYEGEVDDKTELKDGWGTYYYQNGEKYEGFFDDDFIHGYGKYYFLGGHYYEGDWDWGQKSGIGQLIFSNKDRYDGYFYEDEFNGPGVLISNNGDEFDGNWKDGKKHGKGIFRGAGPQGRTIIGNWENDELLPF